MMVIPAIDLREGKCVRLVEGRIERETVYSNDPVEMAKKWQDKGAQWLHVVDLDGAFSGTPKNIDIIGQIIKEVTIPVQVGGGIRSLSIVEQLIDLGAKRVIFGTAAIINPELINAATAKYADAVIVGIDAKNGKVAIEGWGVTAEKEAISLAEEVSRMGVERIVFTDIWRDGTLKGPNIQAIEEVCRRCSGLKVIASGGVSTIQDLHVLKKIKPLGVEAVIIGKALYAGTITLEESLDVMQDEVGVQQVC